METILQQSTQETCTATCPNPTGGPVSLFQWKTVTEHVKHAEVLTCFYVCRYGIDTQSNPACPAGACANANCSKCFPWKKDGSDAPEEEEVERAEEIQE